VFLRVARSWLRPLANVHRANQLDAVANRAIVEQLSVAVAARLDRVPLRVIHVKLAARPLLAARGAHSLLPDVQQFPSALPVNAAEEDVPEIVEVRPLLRVKEQPDMVRGRRALLVSAVLVHFSFSSFDVL
jgi:hypothetical protein